MVRALSEAISTADTDGDDGGAMGGHPTVGPVDDNGVVRLPPLALAYHAVGVVGRGEDPHGLVTHPRLLARHIEGLRRWGYRLVSFGDLAADPSPGRAALTFDDGFADNLHELVPVLEAAGAPATVFAVSRLLGQPHPDVPSRRFLTAEELWELARHVEIGSHTAGHVDLGALDEDAASDELRRARADLQELCGGPVDILAYPFGRVSEAAKRAARATGHRAACGISGQGSWSDPFHLPRQDMTSGATLLGLRLKRLDRYEPLVQSPPARAARALTRLVRG